MILAEVRLLITDRPSVCLYTFHILYLFPRPSLIKKNVTYQRYKIFFKTYGVNFNHQSNIKLMFFETNTFHPGGDIAITIHCDPFISFSAEPLSVYIKSKILLIKSFHNQKIVKMFYCIVSNK